MDHATPPSAGPAQRAAEPLRIDEPGLAAILAKHPELRFDVIPVIFGVGVIYSREAPWAERLAAFLKPYVNSPLLERIEELEHPSSP